MTKPNILRGLAPDTVLLLRGIRYRQSKMGTGQLTYRFWAARVKMVASTPINRSQWAHSGTTVGFLLSLNTRMNNKLAFW